MADSKVARKPSHVSENTLYSVSIVVLMTGLKGLELRDLLNISLWIRCAWSAGNYFSNRLQSHKYPVIPNKQ